MKLLNPAAQDMIFSSRVENTYKNENTVLIATNELFHNNFNGTDTRAFEYWNIISQRFVK